jgi:inner membrane protein
MTVRAKILLEYRERFVDNLCHTLVGAALGEAGLKRRTPLGMATLLVGANLPDVDAYTYAFFDGPTALAFRRGWTHGIVAMAVLPVVLAGAMTAFDRTVRRRRRTERPPARFGALLFLAFLAVLSHPLLDFLNTYGVRFLYPSSNRWFYGDALFILDPWVWIALALGIAFSRARADLGRPDAERPARASLAAVGAYVAAMLLSSAAGRVFVERAANEAGLAPARVMVSPEPLDPFRRRVVVEVPGGYRFGTLRWLRRPTVSFSTAFAAKNEEDPTAVAASRTPEGKKFLVWARFPYYEIQREKDQALVSIHDARYPALWASVTVAVPIGLLRSSP